MIENYHFTGDSFHELVECFGLEQKHLIYGERYGSGIDDSYDLNFRPLITEEVEKVIKINGNKITFILTDREEIELEKLRQFLGQNCENPSVIEKVRLFLEALAEKSEKTDFNYPVFNGILEIENDEEFIYWVIRNLSCMWT
ncbi:hypothetical protein NSQ62_08440 [Solibacillus sp. FSL H8-0523]|uniref:hypothetical protein n=1 Tax=Solibacillus sp. FSL H8-0523 TaxID=2954511 RepID=UPI003100EF13